MEYLVDRAAAQPNMQAFHLLKLEEKCSILHSALRTNNIFHAIHQQN